MILIGFREGLLTRLTKVPVGVASTETGVVAVILSVWPITPATMAATAENANNIFETMMSVLLFRSLIKGDGKE